MNVADISIRGHLRIIWRKILCKVGIHDCADWVDVHNYPPPKRVVSWMRVCMMCPHRENRDPVTYRGPKV